MVEDRDRERILAKRSPTRSTAWCMAERSNRQHGTAKQGRLKAQTKQPGVAEQGQSKAQSSNREYSIVKRCQQKAQLPSGEHGVGKFKTTTQMQPQQRERTHNLQNDRSTRMTEGSICQNYNTGINTRDLF
eukprot:scaffold34419_cov62-Cyclotella_meneghiniana.AAC.4